MEENNQNKTEETQKLNVKEFISSFFKQPIAAIEQVADSKKKFLKIAIIILAIWVVVSLIGEVVGLFQSSVFYFTKYMDFWNIIGIIFSAIFSVITSILGPIISVAALSGIIFFMLRKQKKSFIGIASTVAIAKVPVVVASIFSLINILGNVFYKIANPFTNFLGNAIFKLSSSVSGLCGVLSMILIYFGLKTLCGESDHNKFARKFVIIMAIFYGIKFVLSFVGIAI